MSWNYRLVRDTSEGHILPRICEVFYNDEGEPQFFSVESIWTNIYWATIVPLMDIFRRKPLKDTDMKPDKSTEEMMDFGKNIGTARMLAVEKDENETHYITIPDDMAEELGWEIEDTVEWSKTEMCTDDGEYPSYTLVNESLEERMKNKVKAL